MKSFFVLASLVATCIAQGIQIGVPAAGTTVSPGQNLTVEVDRPVSTAMSAVDIRPSLLTIFRSNL